MESRRIIGLIPARAGSKRLPGKNIKMLNERPLLSYSVLAAVESEWIHETVISTDSEELGAVGFDFGAKFLKRPDSLSLDFSSTSEVLMHAAQSLGLQNHDLIVTLQPTNPFRPHGLIDVILDWSMKREQKWDSILTVTELKAKFGKIINGQYQVINYFHGQRSQDIANSYYQENGLLYITKVSTLYSDRNMFGKAIIPYITEGTYDHIDIDTEEDFMLAELLYPRYKNRYNLI